MNSITKFAKAPSFLINNNNIFEQTSSHCAYEIFQNGFLRQEETIKVTHSLFQKDFLANHYKMQKPLKEEGELGQLILTDNDEGMKVIKHAFVLKQQYSDSILINLTNPNTDNNTKQLIIDILLRVVAVRMKRIMFNPLTRDLPNGQRVLQEI